jgi:integrase
MQQAEGQKAPEQPEQPTEQKKKSRKRRGRGEGGVYQRADGRWTASLSLGLDQRGKRKRRVVYGESKADVQAKLRALYNKADAPRELERLTVEQYLAKWLELVKPTVEHGTYMPYKRHCENHINPVIGTLKLTKLARFHIEELYGALAKNGVSAAMQRKIGTTLTIALGAAVDKDLLTFNPATRVRKPKATKPEIRPLDADQVATLLDAAKQDRLLAFYCLALDSGCRPGELLALEWPDLDFDRGRVTIKKSLAVDAENKLRVKDCKTKKGRRQLRLSSFTVAALHEHRKAMLAEGHAGGPVFCSATGGYTDLSNLHHNSFKPLLKRAGLPNIRLYDLRHTCATLLLMAGENIKVVSERLGHASVVLTLDVYSHVLPGMQEQAAAKMEAILNRPQRTAAKA